LKNRADKLPNFNNENQNVCCDGNSSLFALVKAPVALVHLGLLLLQRPIAVGY